MGAGRTGHVGRLTGVEDLRVVISVGNELSLIVDESKLNRNSIRLTITHV